MSDGEGGAAFGFAPRKDPARRNVDRRDQQARPRPARPRRVAQKPDEPPAAPMAYGDSSFPTQPYWIWLLIGALLGAGGTMVASSFWLQDVQIIQSAAVQNDVSSGTEPVEDLPGRSGQKPFETSGLENDLSPPIPPPSDTAVAETAVLPRSAMAEEVPVTEDLLAEERLNVLVRDSSADTEETDRQGLDLAPDNARPSQEPQRQVPTVSSVDEILLSSKAASDETPAVILTTIGSQDGQGASAVDQAVLPEPSAAAASDKILAAVPEEERGAVDVDAEIAGFDPKKPSQSALRPEDDIAGVQASGQLSASSPASEDAVKPAAPAPSFKDTEIARAADGDGGVESAQPPRRPDRLYRVQLAAVTDEAAAHLYWRDLQQNLPAIFAGVQPTFDRREVEQRLFFRIWVGEFDQRADADDYCGWLKTKGQDCFVTRG